HLPHTFSLFFSLSISFHSIYFFFNDTSTTAIYTLSLHDALPISRACCSAPSPTNDRRVVLAADSLAHRAAPQASQHPHRASDSGPGSVRGAMRTAAAPRSGFPGCPGETDRPRPLRFPPLLGCPPV